MSQTMHSAERHMRSIRWLLTAGLTVALLFDGAQGDWPSPWLVLWLAAIGVHLLSYAPRPSGREPRLLLFLVLDILLWNGVVLLTGGASNPFAALLLIPLVLAFLLLSPWSAGLVLVVSIVCQLLQLLFVPDSPMGHTAMSGHFFAMALGFVIAASLLALTLLYLRGQIRQRDRDLHALRETQLRDEQLLAIGTAAAQLTHEMATPVQSVRLLLEEQEALQAVPSDPALQADSRANLDGMRQQLSRMEQLLADWREIAEDVRERRQQPVPLPGLITAVRELLVITRPGERVQWEGLERLQGAQVSADRTLIPAVLSLLHNALEAAGEGTVFTHSECDGEYWRLTIRNGGQSLSPELQGRLGAEFVESDSGFGVGALVSYATLERFGGKVYWQSGEQGTSTILELPLATAQPGESDL